MLIMVSDHRLWGRIMPWRDGRLLGGTCRFKVCDVGGNDFGLPFLDRVKERLRLGGQVEWP
jgi:hypothetical protein